FEILKDKRPLLVCDAAFEFLSIELPGEVTRFSGFTSNPRYEDIEAGVALLKRNGCDFIVAIGGGSSIDTAKCIKHFSLDAALPLMAVPTTSGTGSEATHFAVMYKNGEKVSVADAKLLPDYVILQPDVLKTLPLYQKKCTMLDALCQAIESWWSKKATPESINYASQAIKLALTNMESYLANEDDGNRNMLIAANFSGKAINITTTTAPHAMSYKLTSLYGLPHGHAVAICLPKVWRYMGNFDDIAKALDKRNHTEAISFLEQLLNDMGILPPENATVSDIDVLVNSVNPVRLSNNPVPLDEDTLRALYREILAV
ncbi:MAG: phosphonoacetaldehyde reductase, partial [Propionibacteriaceae bacterium]|nr:phosphonoacetaldehyde reductase [Propionibacteriaceae bacterium]